MASKYAIYSTFYREKNIFTSLKQGSGTFLVNQDASTQLRVT